MFLAWFDPGENNSFSFYCSLTWIISHNDWTWLGRVSLDRLSEKFYLVFIHVPTLLREEQPLIFTDIEEDN